MKKMIIVKTVNLLFSIFDLLLRRKSLDFPYIEFYLV